MTLDKAKFEIVNLTKMKQMILIYWGISIILNFIKVNLVQSITRRFSNLNLLKIVIWAVGKP